MCCAVECYGNINPISSKVPDPNGPLSREMLSGAIGEANKSVEIATEQNSDKKYGRENMAALLLNKQLRL